MNGQLSEHPLAELFREISTKGLSGRLRLQRERIAVVAYFREGAFAYAASNFRTLRLREYLQKSELISETTLARFGSRQSDLDLAKTLCAQQLINPHALERLQVRQISDVLRLALLWTEGTWEFDYRSHLNEEANFTIDTSALLLDTGRRLPMKFTASRFRNPAEMISPITALPDSDYLQPPEAFLLSRLDSPTVLSDLVAVSGLRESVALRLIYSLALAGFIHREHWQSAFRDQPTPKKSKTPEVVKVQASTEESQVIVAAPDDLDAFLERLSAATSHYEVLGVANNAAPAEFKSAYYDLARHYHPDRVRMRADPSLQARIESAFARITQAYETLKDAGLRATYDSKLSARARVKDLSQSAPKAKTTAQPPGAKKPAGEKIEDHGVSDAQQAELQFKEGFAALEMGQRNVAIGLLAAAARAVPNEPRYRAYYGHALATHESTRRLAEVELQAAVNLEPSNAEYRMMLAELYRDLGFLVRAKGEAQRAVAAAPDNSKARDLLRNLK